MRKNVGLLRTQFFLIILTLPSCIHRKHIDKQKLFIKNSPESTENITTNRFITSPSFPITIWVHGTIIVRKPNYHLGFSNKATLIPMLSLPEKHHFRLLATAMTSQDPQLFPLEEFYAFSWSGKLDEQERKEAANTLYSEIITLHTTYRKKYGKNPIIRIISHSHGGNVVLNMAHIKNNLHGLQIESVILLACPVQEKTKNLICTPLFKHVYSLYSSFDIIQVIAPQFKMTRSTSTPRGKIKYKHHYCIPPFSSRLFPSYSHLTQAKIKINDFPISHTQFSTSRFTALLPLILQKLHSWHRDSLINNTIGKHKLLCVYKNN